MLWAVKTVDTSTLEFFVIRTTVCCCVKLGGLLATMCTRDSYCDIYLHSGTMRFLDYKWFL